MLIFAKILTYYLQMTKYKHWHLERDEEAILWLGFNREDSSVNTINQEVLMELKQIVDEIPQEEYLGLIIYSLKTKGFIAGADIHEFSQFDEVKIEAFLQLGQDIFNQLATLSIPTVAMIKGFCLGGGTELALACRYRVMEQEESFMGLPEVLLGIMPGWGGMTRLPNLIGGFRALTRMLLTGKNIYPKEALKLGLVDAVVPYRQLRAAAVYHISGRQKTFPYSRNAKYNELRLWISRNVGVKFIRNRLKKRVNPRHYPAPYAILDVFEKGIETLKIKSLISPNGTARELIRLFLLKDELKNIPMSTKVLHVHIVGAGVMGGDIAAWCALKGLKVTLQDVNVAMIGKAINRATQFFKKHQKNGQLPNELQAACDRLIPDFQGNGITHADVIIEAIAENLEAKQAFFKMAEAKAKPEAILATNTSSLSIKTISTVLRKPERLVGIHFFNPATKMELVEVVQKDIIKILAFAVQIGKLPIPVKDSPGFLVNRVLMPYLMECMKLLDEGVSADRIDAAAIEFGMMMGPVELADTVGLDICLAVAQNLTDVEIPKKLQKKVAQGELGKKTGKGFFRYNQHGKKKRLFLDMIGKFLPEKVRMLDKKEIASKLVAQIIRESEICLKEGVVADQDILDAAMVYSTGFAPFRGGPMRYARELQKVVNFYNN